MVAAIGLTLAMTGCAREAGYEVDVGTFGDATMNNTLVMNGERDYAVSLAQRFEREIPTTVNFEFDSYLLDGEAQQVLDRQADWIRQFPEVKFKVFGFTDAVGTNAYNNRLGQRRANAVVRYLSSRGISRSRLEALVSYGETRPVIDTPNRERQNRRSVTEVAGFVKRHPTVLDGKYAEVVYREYVSSAIPRSGLSGFEDTGGFTTEQ
jgi:outer membrane protein OmpA-like peptidoglycan-associated protein